MFFSVRYVTTARKPFFGDLGTVLGKGVQGFSMLQLCRIWFGRTMGSESKAPKKGWPFTSVSWPGLLSSRA